MYARIAAAALGLMGVIGPGLVQAGDADFLLVNRTGYAIREIYVSPSQKKTWGPDRLGRSILENGRQRQFKLGQFADCMQDMQVVFDDDGSEVIWERLDLCDLEKITLRYNRRTGEVSAETE